MTKQMPTTTWLKETVQKEIDEEHLPEDAMNLITPNPRCSQFYVLPKIHKQGNPGRPIVSAYNCPTERISSYIDDVLRPIVTSLPSYRRESSDAITKVKNLSLYQ